MAMGKNKRSPLAQLLAMPSPVMDKMPERQPEARIRKAKNGGYIITKMGKEGYSSEEEVVYESMEGVVGCLEKHFKDDA